MRARTGQVIDRGDGRYAARVTLSGNQRPVFELPTCKTFEAATELAGALADLAGRLIKGGHESIAKGTLSRVAAGEAADLNTARTMVDRLERGGYKPTQTSAAVTFGQLAKQWTSGELATLYPDHVKRKRSADTDVHRLKHILPLLKDTPIATFKLDDAERVMHALPPSLSRSSRRQVAQCMRKVLAFAVFPCRLVAAHPMPPGWLPKLGPSKAKTCAFPDEDAKLMAAASVPLAFRVFYGFLHREGLRKEEALGLRWSDIDLERGAVTLDKNKTDDPRAWALDHGVVEALKLWHAHENAEPNMFVFRAVDDGHSKGERHDAERYRAHLFEAGVDRAELFRTDATRRRLRLHDTRATFITTALANGKSETWVSDRTGHKSSAQIANYRRLSRTVAELGLGELEPLHLALPEFAKLAGPGDGSAPKPKGTGKGTKSTAKLAELADALDSGFENQPKTAAKRVIQQGNDAGRDGSKQPVPIETASLPFQTDPLEASLVSLSSSLARATEAGAWAVAEQLAASIARLTEELRERRQHAAGVVQIDRKRPAR